MSGGRFGFTNEVLPAMVLEQFGTHSILPVKYDAKSPPSIVARTDAMIVAFSKAHQRKVSLAK